MKKILVCQHVAHELLGTLVPLCKISGFRIRYVNFGRTPEAEPSLDGYSGLIILGGPMNVDDPLPYLKYEIFLLQEAFKRDIPVLGICLGAQLIAKALGAKVKKNPQKEIGWYDLSLTQEAKKDPLFSHFNSTEKVFQWHGDTFELPRNTVHLATTKNCPMQALRYGDKVYGLQFHLEVDEKMIHRWLKIPANETELLELKGVVDRQTILNETPLYISRLKELSELTFLEFIKLFKISKKYRRLSYK